jgi:hypothetical protein
LLGSFSRSTFAVIEPFILEKFNNWAKIFSAGEQKPFFEDFDPLKLAP